MSISTKVGAEQALAANADVEPIRMTQAEATGVALTKWLDGHGVVHSGVETIAMGLIDTKASRDNQARMIALVSASVERFTIAMKRGDLFPPIILYFKGNRLVILDGNNRHEAAIKAGHKTISGIIISPDTPSEMIQLLMVEGNTKHGETPSLEWRLRQAQGLVGQGYAITDAAEACGITASQYNLAAAADKAIARAARMGIQGFDKLGKTLMQKLGTLSDDKVFHAASAVVIETRLSQPEVAELIGRLKKRGSEADRLQLLGELSDSHKVRAATTAALNRNGNAKGGLSSPKNAVATAVGKLLKVDPIALRRSVLTEGEHNEVKKRLEEAADKILVLQVELEGVRFD